MSLATAIARRLYGQSGSQHRVSRLPVSVAVWGIAVGLMVMVVSVCVMLGFKREIRLKVEGFAGDIELLNGESVYAANASPIVVDSTVVQMLAAVPGVEHVQRFASIGGMLKTDDAFQGIMLKGIAEDYDTAFLARHVVAGCLPRFSADSLSQQIVVSRLVADALHLSVGDRVYAYFFAQAVRARRYTVAAVYETHLREFDSRVVYTDMPAVQQLAGWAPGQCAGAELRLTSFDDIGQVLADVHALMHQSRDAYGAVYVPYSIVELYPGLFSWLDVLDTNVYVILVLMLLLSIFTMTAGLLIIILERTRFIAIMKSIGATNAQLRSIFLRLAAMLVGRGMLWGNVLGIGLCLLQAHLHLVRLDAATYYLDSVPVALPWPVIILINAATLLITLMALIVPTHLVARVHPARVMRFE